MRPVSFDMAAVFVVGVVVGICLSYLFSYHLTRPLSLLVAAVRGVARGDLTQRMELSSRDEVGELGKAFNNMADELETKEKARRDLMHKVISSQEDERRRIARELHDDLAQQLTAILAILESLESGLPEDRPQARQMVQRARSVVVGSLGEIRRLIADLRPTVLDDLGLVPAIRTYAETHLSATGAEVKLSEDGLPERLDGDVETAVFRIVQEAVSNIRRHASATSVRILLRVSDGTLCGEIADDGEGFDCDEAKKFDMHGKGLGLQGMEERARLLGGTLSVYSMRGQGTTVSFFLPLSGGLVGV
ncbi:MAG: HAMP domain-containing protein [Chloroflexi bacterium]|nr:HAMP domain-containing protein [Chloroflexota bacterium]